MNANHDLERRIADFYASEAPGRAPDWVLGAALATIDSTPQRRAPFGLPWRISQLQTYGKFALGSAAAFLIAITALVALRPAAVPGPGNDVSPSPALTSEPPSTPLPALTQTFSSDIHGISVSYPGGWVVVQATEQWTRGVPFQGSDFSDLLDPPGVNEFILSASQPLLGRSADAWIAEMTGHPDWGDTCPPTSEPVAVDGATGVVVTHCPDDGVTSTLVIEGGRGYVFVLYGLDPQLFDEILASVQLRPEEAVDASPAPSIGGG